MRKVVVVVIVRVELEVVVVAGGVVVVSVVLVADVVSVVFVTVVGKVTVRVTEVVVDLVVVVMVVVVVVGGQIMPDITSGFVLRRGRSCGSTLLRKHTRAKPLTLFALPHVHAPQLSSRMHSVRQAPGFGIGPSLRRAIRVK